MTGETPRQTVFRVTGTWPTYLPPEAVDVAAHRARHRERVGVLVRAWLAGDDRPALVILHDHPPTIERRDP